MGFTAGHTAATNAQHKGALQTGSEGLRRSEDGFVQYDQSHTLRRIDRAHQMKHFAICSFISPSGSQWKSMVIKLYQQRVVCFISLLGLATVYAMLSSQLVML